MAGPRATRRAPCCCWRFATWPAASWPSAPRAAAIAGLEEPEAHLSFAAQQRIGEALRGLVGDPASPPFQLFVSSHSYLMTDLGGDRMIYFETTLDDGSTRIERRNDPQRLAARFPSPSVLPEDRRKRRPLGANLVRLSDEAVRHLGADPGDLLIEAYSEDGTLRLITIDQMDAYRAPSESPQAQEDGGD